MDKEQNNKEEIKALHIADIVAYVAVRILLAKTQMEK